MSDKPSSGLLEQLRSAVSPQALLLAVVGAAVTALVGRLTAHFFVAVAIFLLAVTGALVYSRARTPAGQTTKRRVLLAACLIAVITAAGTLAVGTRNELTKGTRDEEALLSSLSAGQDFSRFDDALGPPDTKRPSGKYFVYQFERARETVQAVVSTVGVVVSYAIYAKTPDFHPSFNHGAAVTLNTTPVGSPDGVAANIYCGAHKAGYFEDFGGDNAEEARYFVLGVSDANNTRISVDGICRATMGRLGKCEAIGPASLYLNVVTPKELACIKSTQVGQHLRSQLKTSVYIETAPGLTLLPVMLYPPDEAANLPP